MKTTKGKQQEGVIYFFVHAQIKQTVIVRKDQSDHLLLVTLEQWRWNTEEHSRWNNDNAGAATTLEQQQRWNSDNAGTATPNVQIELLDTLRQ